MKFLFVLEFYYPNIGGNEKLFKQLCEKLVSEGNTVTVLTNKFNKNLLANEIINGVNIVRLNFKSRFLFTFLSVFSVIKYAKESDIIHTTSYNAALPAFFGGKIARKKIVITFHEVWGSLWFRLPFISKISKIAFFLFEQLILNLPFDKFIAVSDFTKQRLVKHNVNPKRVVHIYNGMNYSGLLNNIHLPPKNFTYTFFGRLGSSKGIDLLLCAAEKFNSRNIDAQLKLIVPKTPVQLHKKILILVKKYNLQKQITILHHLSESELLNHLLNSSCVVIPSYSEGFGYAAAEASALGIPIISSDMGALKEVVSNKFIKMKSLDSESLYEALVKAKNGKWDESPLKMFLLDNQIDEYTKLYKSL